MDPAEQPRELYIVEGDSAAIAVESVCNHDFQAVLPMQGKPLNAWKASQAKVANYELYSQLLHVLGESLGASSFPTPSPFDRVHLLFDPDADGIHCTVLMLWFFHRWLPHWLASGRIFAVAAPLCELTSASAAKVWYQKIIARWNVSWRNARAVEWMTSSAGIFVASPASAASCSPARASTPRPDDFLFYDRRMRSRPFMPSEPYPNR